MKAPQWISRLLKGERLAAVVLLLGQLTAAFGAVFVNIFAARVLTPSDRGELAFALQIAYFLTVFAVMGLERPYIALRSGGFYAEYKNFTKLLVPGVILIIPATVIIAYFSPLGGNWWGVGLVMLAAYTALNTLTKGVRVGYITSRDWRKFGTNALLTQIIIILGTLCLTLLEQSSPVAWLAIYVGSTIPSVMLLFVSIPRASNASDIDATQRRSLRRRGWKLLPSDFSNTAMMRADRLMLPVLSNAAELGLYVTVATVLEMVSWPVKQWVDASLKRWTGAKSDLAFLVGKMLRQSFFLLILAAALLSIAAFVMVQVLLPDSYSQATAAIPALAISSVIFGLTRIQQGLLIAFDAAGRVSVVEIISTSVSFVAYFLLIPAYGMLGAAYGSITGYLVCYLLGAITLWQVKKEYQK